MSKDIHTLISDLAKGDINALAELYDMLSLRIFNYARMIIKNKEMAEDVTHDVFLQINKEAAQIAKTSNPAAYIMIITRNHSYNLIKRENRVASSLDDALEINDNSSPYDKLIFEEALAKIQNAPLVTVKWRYGKALSKLRAYFKEDEEENFNGTL